MICHTSNHPPAPPSFRGSVKSILGGTPSTPAKGAVPLWNPDDTRPNVTLISAIDTGIVAGRSRRGSGAVACSALSRGFFLS